MGYQQHIWSLPLLLLVPQLLSQYLVTCICIHWWTLHLPSSPDCSTRHASSPFIWHTNMSPLRSLLSDSISRRRVVRKEEIPDHLIARHMLRVGDGIPFCWLSRYHLPMVPEEAQSCKCYCCIWLRDWGPHLFPCHTTDYRHNGPCVGIPYPWNCHPCCQFGRLEPPS